MSKQTDKIKELRERAEGDLEFFIRLVHPHRVLGSIHIEVIRWWTRDNAQDHQLLLLPRDHGKSALIAYRVAWEVTRNPAIRVLYISATSGLATKQLKFIKDLLTCDNYRRYWPEMVHPEEAKREKWTETEISVDHPLRKKESIRDATVFTAGLTTTITGLHCDIAVLDDVVVKENAYTEEGRNKVRSQYSLLSSIEGAESKEWAVGTRYHPADLWNDLMETNLDIYNEDGEIIDAEGLYEVFERQVESIGDGTGEFLWPRQQRYDGKWFGFNQKILGTKRAKYLDKTQFRAQYYNNPNATDLAGITNENFNYYKREFVSRKSGKWYFNGKRLNVFASVDFAYSLSKRSDYTAIVVVGVDSDHQYYVLDIARFKGTNVSDYFAQILALHQKWDFRKIRAEVTAAQKVIVNGLKDEVTRHGLALMIDEYSPSRLQGSKEERIEGILQYRYKNGQIWHYRGGLCQTLEEELVMRHPPHDDIKDCLAAAIDVSTPPSSMVKQATESLSKMFAHSRFGGIG